MRVGCRSIVVLLIILGTLGIGTHAAWSSVAYVYDGGAAASPGVGAAAAVTRGDQPARDVLAVEPAVKRRYDTPSSLARAYARLVGYRSAPRAASRYVIGGMEDLGAGSLRAGEATVASRLPANAGNRLGNWLNNRDVLRSIMRKGRPIPGCLGR